MALWALYSVAESKDVFVKGNGGVHIAHHEVNMIGACDHDARSPSGKEPSKARRAAVIT